jgi:hypothetical protein
MPIHEFEKDFHRRPFNPFVIRLDDGMHYDVFSPDWVAHVLGSRHFIVIDVLGTGQAVIDLDHVTRLTFTEPALAAEERATD